MPSYPMKKIYGWKGVLEVKEEATGKQTPSLGRRLMQRYLIDGLSGMAMGLFCTLIVGLILKQIGGLIGDNWVSIYPCGFDRKLCHWVWHRYRDGRKLEDAETGDVLIGRRRFHRSLCLAARRGYAAFGQHDAAFGAG